MRANSRLYDRLNVTSVCIPHQWKPTIGDMLS
jgi:hypothetical protein